MSRRDTIIIAILVNAGLLMVLFATAMTSKEELPNDNFSSVQLVNNQIKEPLKPIAPEASNNRQTAPLQQQEMEQVLNQYVAVSAFPEMGTEEISMESSAPTLVKEQVEKKQINNAAQIVVCEDAQKSLNQSQMVSVSVKKGDYLDKIAKANGTTVNDIMKVNQLESTQLKIGQILKIPLNAESSKATDEKIAQKQTDPEYYVVKAGDNPWLIASKNQVKLEDLLRLNNLDDQKAKKLKPGDKLRIR